MKQLWLSCSGNRARHASAVMPVIRLYRLLETRRSLHSYLHCSFLVGFTVFRLFRSPRGIRDDSRALGNPSKMEFSPCLGRLARRKGCAVPESVVGCCRQWGWEAPPGAACTPLPASRCLPTTVLLPPVVCCPGQQLWLHLPTASPVLTLSY